MAEVQMVLTTSAGAYDFGDSGDLPIIGRGMEYARRSREAPCLHPVKVSLSGFLLGNDHHEIVAKYMELRAICEGADAHFYYYDGARVVIDTDVFLDDMSEPDGWKQYNGDYRVDFHYTESDPLFAPGRVPASFVTEVGTYQFELTPVWGRSMRREKSSPRAPYRLPSGKMIETGLTISLKGDLYADNRDQLEVKRAELENFFAYTGILNYGSFSGLCYVGGVSIPEYYPHNHLEYGIELVCEVPDGIYEFESEISYGRLHRNPKIVKRPYCGDVLVTEYNVTGQEVQYTIRVKAATLAMALIQASIEVPLLVIPGGIEMEGGSQRERYQDGIVDIMIKKFYKDPVKGNIG